MTPRIQTLAQPPKVRIPRILLILGSLIPIAGVVGAGARGAKHLADETYVRTDSFSLWHLRDSLIAASDAREMKRTLASLDSSDRCRRHQPGFCR